MDRRDLWAPLSAYMYVCGRKRGRQKTSERFLKAREVDGGSVLGSFFLGARRMRVGWEPGSASTPENESSSSFRVESFELRFRTRSRSSNETCSGRRILKNTP